MATPTSYPRPSPQKQPQSHLTPASAASPPPPSSTHSTRTISSPQYAKKAPFQHQQQPHRATNNGANGVLQYPSPGASGTPMSRSGTNNTAIGAGFGGGTPMARTATNGSVAMARTGTNSSSIAGRTPVTMRAGRATSAGSTTTVGADSPAITAAATLLMEGVTASNATAAGGIAAKGLTPQDGTGLGLGLTPLGGAASGAGGSLVSGLVGMAEKDQEEERRRRLEVITGLLGGRWGWVGQEGVERCARRIGFECLWEEGMGGDGRRTLSIAGEGVLIEVAFSGDSVLDVGLSFPASRESVGKWASKGATMLKQDLLSNDPAGREGYVALEEFTRNLQRLRQMDQLSTESFGCFDAVDGIFKSLETIHEWEVRSAEKQGRTLPSDVVLFEHSGIPQMHSNGCIGLGLEYWKETGLVDRRGHDASSTVKQTLPLRTWSALIECEGCLSSVYTPARISDQWVSAGVERPTSQIVDEKHISNTTIDWLNVPVDSTTGDNGTRAEVKYPDVRFISRFEPPIIVPLQLAMQICDSVSWPIDQTTDLPTTYEAVLFTEQDAKLPLLGGPRIVEQVVDSPASQGNDRSARTSIQFTLFTQEADYARPISELPFKHPMQLVNLLPTLRQWALVSSLLLNAFTTPSPSPSQIPTGVVQSAQTNGASEDSEHSPVFQTLEEEFADFLSSPAQPASMNIDMDSLPSVKRDATGKDGNNDKSSRSLAVNVAFTTTAPAPVPDPMNPATSSVAALPRFTIQFPTPKYDGKLATVAFSVGLNGTIEGVDVDDGRPVSLDEAAGVDGAAEANLAAAAKLRAQAKKVIEVSQSIAVLAQWLSR